jgi:hypothetical protein
MRTGMPVSAGSIVITGLAGQSPEVNVRSAPGIHLSMPFFVRLGKTLRV